MRIAITGGIASGKTTLCKNIEMAGFKVFYSDIEAKKIANNNPEVKAKIIEAFGECSYINGKYNTSCIGNIVFNDSDQLDVLNKCFGDTVINRFMDFSYKKEEVYFFESALIFEHNLQDYFDLIIGVFCEDSTALERLRSRNNLSEVEAKRIIATQLPQRQKMERCDIVINTTGEINYSALFYFIQQKTGLYRKNN